jgi:hypothetical protein
MDNVSAHPTASPDVPPAPTVAALVARAEGGPPAQRGLLVAYVRWLWLERRLSRADMATLVRRLPELVPLQ